MSSHSPQPASGALTRYPSGSVKEAWSVIFPLIMTSTSMSLMLFFDRLIVAQYSTRAMTAVASAGIVVATIEFAFIGVAGIAEVFVGQYNGAKEYGRVAQPVWQMIWFSLSTAFITIPLALFFSEFFIADPLLDLGVPFFKTLMFFSFLMPLFSALSAFFVGLGQAKIVTYVTILGNIINIILDYVLVFGIEGWVPSLGTKGAAMASSIALGLQCLTLGYLFLSVENRKKYKTHVFKFQVDTFLKCLKIGTPTALSHLIELGAWSTQMNMMGRVSDVHLTVVAIGQSIFMLFMFVSDGLSKGMGVLASNYIGAKRYTIVPQSLRSCFKIHLSIIIIVLTLFILLHENLIEMLIEGDYPPETLDQIRYFSRWALIWVSWYLFVDGITWIISGTLMASGDTTFIMTSNGFNAWVFAILPIYIFIVKGGGSPALTWFILAAYGTINSLVFLWRYRSGSWKINRVRKES